MRKVAVDIYDVIIIGDGPAALAAAINVKIRNKNILLMGDENGSLKVNVSALIDNYLAIPSITGPQLMSSMVNHAKDFGVTWSKLRANQVFNLGTHYIVTDKSNSQHQATAVIVATGVVAPSTIEGESSFLGRGVSYCATCDGNFYRNKIVVVLGQNEESVHEANYLAELASKTYFVPLKKLSAKLSPNIEMLLKKVIAVAGDGKVEKIIFNDAPLACDAVFILRDATSNAYLVPGIEEDAGHIKVNVHMETNLKGLYACGDCTGKPYQLMKATGQGQSAALNAVNYLDGIG